MFFILIRYLIKCMGFRIRLLAASLFFHFQNCKTKESKFMNPDKKQYKTLFFNIILRSSTKFPQHGRPQTLLQIHVFEAPSSAQCGKLPDRIHEPLTL